MTKWWWMTPKIKRKSRMERNSCRCSVKACLFKRTGFFVFAALLSALVSCDSVTKQGGKAGKIMPDITGGAGEVLVVMDNFNWENRAGELLQDILKEEIPGLPQSEPLFDVIHITSASFDDFYQFHRTIVLTDIESGLEPKVRFRENVWAKPQILVQLEAPSSEALHQFPGAVRPQQAHEDIPGFQGSRHTERDRCTSPGKAGYTERL